MFWNKCVWIIHLIWWNRCRIFFFFLGRLRWSYVRATEMRSVCVCACVRAMMKFAKILLFSFDVLRLRNNHFAQLVNFFARFFTSFRFETLPFGCSNVSFCVYAFHYQFIHRIFRHILLVFRSIEFPESLYSPVSHGRSDRFTVLIRCVLQMCAG